MAAKRSVGRRQGGWRAAVQEPQSNPHDVLSARFPVSLLLTLLTLLLPPFQCAPQNALCGYCSNAVHSTFWNGGSAGHCDQYQEGASKVVGISGAAAARSVCNAHHAAQLGLAGTYARVCVCDAVSLFASLSPTCAALLSLSTNTHGLPIPRSRSLSHTYNTSASWWRRTSQRRSRTL